MKRILKQLHFTLTLAVLLALTAAPLSRAAQPPVQEVPAQEVTVQPEPGQEEPGQEVTVQEETGQEETGQEVTVQEETTQEEAAPEEAAPEEAAQEPLPGETAPRIGITSLATADGDWTGALTDDSYETAVAFDAGDEMTLRTREMFSSVYIEWARIPSPWTLTAGDRTISCGENGFLHEFVSLGTESDAVTFSFPSECRIANIRVFGAGRIPPDVQNWKTPCEKADFLVFSTHADDEILFLGGVLATYAADRDLDVQVAYLIDFTNVMPVREHEKLDGLWTIGVRHYPVNGSFLNDDYSTALDAARTTYSYDAACAFTTEAVRRFRPLVVVTQDFNGEYGHGAHMLLASAVADAVNGSADATRYPDSAGRYDAYDVPKAYFHLYPENAIRLDLRQPIARFDGKTAVELAQEAYRKHVSQQWMDFYVSDDPDDTHKFAPKSADFGLYRTTVGEDTGNDMMEHLIPYAEQEILAEQELLRQQEAEEAERIRAAEEAAMLAEQARIEEAQRAYDERQAKKTKQLRYAASGAALLLVLILVTFILSRRARSRRRKRSRRVRSFSVEKQAPGRSRRGKGTSRTGPDPQARRKQKSSTPRPPRTKNRRGY